MGSNLFVAGSQQTDGFLPTFFIQLKDLLLFSSRVALFQCEQHKASPGRAEVSRLVLMLSVGVLCSGVGRGRPVSALFFLVTFRRQD